MREISPVFKKICTLLACGVLAALSGCWYDSNNSDSTASSSTNVAPSISGVPGASAVVGESYRFVPVVTDANGDQLSFSVVNLPSWASFSSVTGEIYGTPQASDVGSYGGIRVNVSDGRVTSSLAAFSIVVAASSASATGTALLSWQAPTLNEDGTPIVGLVGYKIYYGRDVNAMNVVIPISGADNTHYNFTNLANGTHYFGVVAVTAAGEESRLSGIASKTIS